MTLLLSIVVFTWVSFLGFDATSYTDVVQGCVIFVALCVGPIYMGRRLGTLDGSVELKCEKTWFEVVPNPDVENAMNIRRCGRYVYKVVVLETCSQLAGG